MNILGVSCCFHGAAAALLRDGVLVAAAEEERFTRKKHDFGFPEHAIDFCLRTGGIHGSGLDFVAFFEFYDGFNDVYVGAYYPALPSAHFEYTEIKTKFESAIISWPGIARRLHLFQVLTSIRHRLGCESVPVLSHEELASRARTTLDNYEFNLALARTLARAYGFEIRFFWQPALAYGNKPLDSFEKMVRDLPPERTAVRAVYEEAGRRSAASGGFIFLGRLFDGISLPLYVDQVHLRPRGNEIAAGAIVQAVSSIALVHPGKHSLGATK